MSTPIPPLPAVPVLGELVDQPSPAPSVKVRAVGAAGIATGVLLYLAHLSGLQLPTEVAEAIVLAGGFAGGYLKRDKAVAAVVTRVEHALTPIEHAARHAAPELEVLAPVIEGAVPGLAPAIAAAVEAVRGPEAPIVG